VSTPPLTCVLPGAHVRVRVQTSVASGSYFHDAAPHMAPGMAPMGLGVGPMHGAPGGMVDPTTGAFIPPPAGIDAGGAPGSWQPRAFQGHVIEEDEGPRAPSTAPPSGPPSADFSFPVATASAPDSPTAVPPSAASYAGASTALSAGTGVPSQSLTGILNNANALLGEMGNGSTHALTAGHSVALLSRHSLRNLAGAFPGGHSGASRNPAAAGTSTGAFTGGLTAGSASGTGSLAPSRGATPPLPPPPAPRKRSPSPSLHQ
jgi:hypothetical protein